ncbi:MAG TPA: signal recognition particle-docking protein FtsY [Thermoflexales bacterium]|nr:signal recognition particle-docking protein FtsY [Thermoflexales bacterium]HQW35168.1 signal recognition particle-docking protein FtsY [Thermoflexales bacterium]HQX75319.1 signal recognition particle-docking protein FtsY [Thermoflexales bacterium]HQZ22792.1 signal recognition particle-docking protein FtsY [Thermoflexales bacterium]HRA00062.1 signal recognition particle-docking protein FtsY [Thermoflexales bacterium]
MASLRDTLARTRNSMFGRIQTVLGQADITPETWDDLEAVLLQADVGAETTDKVLDALKERAKTEGIVRADKLRDVLKEELAKLLVGKDASRRYDSNRLLEIIMVIGVNGSGKTTSIAKLTKLYAKHGRRVMLAAADTFRAAAIDQLQIWGERNGVPVIATEPNADPGAVVYEAIKQAYKDKRDLLLVDTAGRLHTKHNLMQELKKVRGVLEKNVHEAPHQTLLVIDATNGQNAISQAKGFTDAVGVTGVVLTKLDGTPKGGVAFAIVSQLGIPIKFIGTGEKVDDLQEFDPKEFVDGLFE